MQVNNKKQNNDETFEWVPPDTTKELAMDYMKTLPVEKLPIKGSVGAVLRRQLLQKQLPLHDIDYKICDELSEQEQKQFEKYLENIKRYVGQGKVMKVSYGDLIPMSIIHLILVADSYNYHRYLRFFSKRMLYFLNSPFLYFVRIMQILFSDVCCSSI